MIKSHKIKTYIQLLILLVMCINLYSCATGTSRGSAKSGGSQLQIYNIDSDIEDDFLAAVARLKAEDYDAAIKILEKIIVVEKRVPAPYINLAMAYEKKADPKKAEEYLLAAVKLDLSHPVANNQLGMLYRKQGRFVEAKKAYTNALTNNPDYLPVIKNLGILCELYMHDFPCALQQYEHYLDLQPDDKTVTIWVAVLNQR